MRVVDMSARRFIPWDFAFLALAFGAALIVLAAIPIWFEQGMMFSAMVGRSDPMASKAAREFSCRADLALWAIGSIVGVWLTARCIYLYVSRGLSLWTAGARAFFEFLIFLVLCWLVEFILVQDHEPFRASIEAMSKGWCGGGPR